MKYLDPDILCVQELTDVSGSNNILNACLNTDGVSKYDKAFFFDGPDTDNSLYYNSNKLGLVSQTQIATSVRDISEYVLYYKEPGLNAQSDTIYLYVYSTHFKAGSQFSDEQTRDQQTQVLKTELDTRTNGENFILLGDFNVYTDQEPAVQNLLAAPVPFVDPINQMGDWHNNSNYKFVHTQSTRTTSFDNGTTGGMDDRFDFIMCTADVINGNNGVMYTPNTYRAVGQDGQHFNTSLVNTPTNASEPANIIEALHMMSDHLPVYMEVQIGAPIGVEEISLDKISFLHTNNGFILSNEKSNDQVNFEVYTLDGKLLESSSTTFNSHNDLNLQKGIYLIKFEGIKKGFKYIR